MYYSCSVSFGHYHIAGVREPPSYTAPGYAEQPGEWLHRLADQKAPVSCQLLSRRARIEGAPMRNTSALAEFQQFIGVEQTAVCRLWYRPGRQLFRSDLAESLVRYGRASIASGMFVSMDKWKIVDTSERVEDLKKDIEYIKLLEKAEFKAATEAAGMWADPFVRESRQDLVEEVTFQNEATRLQKIWRWLRG
jgi:endonuclease YncB( thermonuclease family)